MVQGAADPLAGGAADALVGEVERRRDGRIATVGVGDRQGIPGDDRLQDRQRPAETKCHRDDLHCPAPTTILQ